MLTSVLLIGGNGFVGRILQSILRSRNPELRIFVGSRNAMISNKEHLHVDVFNPQSFKCIKAINIDMVVLCTSDKENNVLKYCISNKIDYIDIAKPTNEVEQALELIDKDEINSKIVFSSGWMSGIIGILSKWIEPNFKSVRKLYVYIYYSLQDASGKSSADFMAEHVSKPFKVYRNNQTNLEKYYTKPQTHHYLLGIGKRKTYLFDTPDAFMLNKSEKIPTIETRTAYSSKFITWLLHVLQVTRVYQLLTLNLRKVFFSNSGKGDQTAFDIELEGKNTRQKISLQNSNGQADLTAFATVLHLEKLLKNKLEPGVYFSHQIHNPATFVKQLLSRNSIKIQLDEKNINY